MSRKQTRVVLVTGGGGVGKTTLAAALGVVAASEGHETLVLTVDPAKRLADALGLRHLGNTPTAVPQADHLSAAMLDVTASWEGILDRLATPEVGTRLRQNGFFRAIADRFPAAQSYAAGEQMTAFVELGRWDRVIIDTPPAAGGIDFFDAPPKVRSLVGGRLLRWLTGGRIPGRKTLYRFTAKPVLRMADTVLGGPLLEDIAEFLIDLRTIYDGLARRGKAIERQLRLATTLVVTTADPTPIGEARRFYETLPELGAHPAAVVFNRSLPDDWARALPGTRPKGLDAVRAVALHDNLAKWASVAKRQEEARVEFATRYGTAPATIPWMAEAPTDLERLAALALAARGLPIGELGFGQSLVPAGS